MPTAILHLDRGAAMPSEDGAASGRRSEVTVEERTPRRPRIADVAREAGVSKTAVSFAFNSPDRLAPGTATRIRDVASALGYRPHPVARMLTQRRTRTVGVVTPQALSVIFSNPYFGAFSEGVALAAEQADLALSFISPVRGSLARAVGRATVDGVVVVGLAAGHPEVEQIRAAGLPLVMVDSTALPDYPSVEVDDEGGALLAAEHVLAMGHRDVLMVAMEPSQASSEIEADSVNSRRLVGYTTALTAAGIPVRPQDVVVSPSSTDGGLAALRRAWEDGLRPTAVLAMSDALAIGALRAAHELGLRVPEDLSVVGFDDIDLGLYTNPPLTTVHQPIRRKGEEAVRLLLDEISGRGQPPQHLCLETRLVVRASTASPRTTPNRAAPKAGGHGGEQGRAHTGAPAQADPRWTEESMAKP